MKKQMDPISKWLKNLRGNLIGIGIEEEKYLQIIEENNNIEECNLLNSTLIDHEELGTGKTKFLPIRKLRRRFKKKQTNAMLIHFAHIEPYLKTFIRDSIMITKEEICIYHLTSDQLEQVKKRYHRYTVTFKEEKKDDDIILFINTSSSKTWFLKNWFYFIIDTLENGMELLSDLLVN